jgi:hypothetical protein
VLLRRPGSVGGPDLRLPLIGEFQTLYLHRSRVAEGDIRISKVIAGSTRGISRDIGNGFACFRGPCYKHRLLEWALGLANIANISCRVDRVEGEDCTMTGIVFIS